MKIAARILFCLTVLLAKEAVAVTPPWSSSFNCADWADPAAWTSCESVNLYNAGYSVGGQYSSRTAASNNPLGAGKGFRMWHGAVSNSHTSRPVVDVTHSSSEIWIRIYQRWQSGTNFGSGYIKQLYFNETSGYPNTILIEMDTGGIRYLDPGTALANFRAGGWNEIYPGGVSDGSWHCFEYYFKTGASNGAFSYWVDGALKGSATGIRVPTITGGLSWRVNNSGFTATEWEDMDDISISTTGYIGPIGQAPDTTPPVISSPLPSGSQNCSANPQVATLSVATNENATCRYSLTDIAYASMSNTFTTTGGTTHSRSINFGCDAAYTYYVRCIDPAANANTTSTQITFSVAAQSTAATLFSDGFDDPNFSGRGWFDDTAVSLDATTKYAGASSLKLTWTAGQTTAALIGAMRRSFTATDEVYVSMYWRFNTDWVGSGVAYHPHLIHVMSDLDDPWGGLAYNYLEAYIETHILTPRIEFQDGRNVNTSLGGVPNNLTATTETRDVAGCNGTLAGSDAGTTDCYSAGGGLYRNGRWFSGTQDFASGTWHKVEAYLKLNTIVGGIAQPDGIMRMWVDGAQVINNTHTVYRTNQRATINWRTLVIAPYIGDGSPQAQTMWIDELVVMDGMPNVAPAPPASFRLGTGGAIGLGSGGSITLQ